MTRSNPVPNRQIDELSKKCVLEASYSKVIVLLVDAFRYDFAVWNSTLDPSESLPYQNRMPYLHQLLTHSSDNAKLFKIYADPPTTTMQRIKGKLTNAKNGHNYFYTIH